MERDERAKDKSSSQHSLHGLEGEHLDEGLMARIRAYQRDFSKRVKELGRQGKVRRGIFPLPRSEWVSLMEKHNLIGALKSKNTLDSREDENG